MKAHLTKVSLALLSTVFLLGCQDLGSGPVGPEGPQFDKADFGGPCPVERDVKGHCHGGGDGGGGGNQFVFVDVELTGWMKTDPLDEINQMELARKPGIMKIRANTEKAGTPFLHFAIDMEFTLAASLLDLNANCEWSGRVEQTPENEQFAADSMLPGILNDSLVIERSVLVVIDESALVETVTGSGVYVGVSEDNRMNIWPGFRVLGSPMVTVVGDPAGDDFTATFSGGKVDMRGIPPGERNQIILKCNIFDDITFTVVGRS